MQLSNAEFFVLIAAAITANTGGELLAVLLRHGFIPPGRWWKPPEDKS